MAMTNNRITEGKMGRFRNVMIAALVPVIAFAAPAMAQEEVQVDAVLFNKAWVVSDYKGRSGDRDDGTPITFHSDGNGEVYGLSMCGHRWRAKIKQNFPKLSISDVYTVPDQGCTYQKENAYFMKTLEKVKSVRGGPEGVILFSASDEPLFLLVAGG